MRYLFEDRRELRRRSPQAFARNIARNSLFTYKRKPVDTKQVARDLGVRYILEGSVRKSGNRVRLTGQFIEAESGRHLWADRFDGDLVDIFDLQDQRVTSVVGAIAPQLEKAEIERAGDGTIAEAGRVQL